MRVQMTRSSSTRVRGEFQKRELARRIIHEFDDGAVAAYVIAASWCIRTASS